jgi:geranylgeranyl pyrophosphate synthase
MSQIDPMTEDRLRIALAGSMPLPAATERHLRDSLLHALHAPGRLARPRILLQVSSAYGQPDQAGEDLAVAIEYFHTASLLFDDLPCMDDASHRRGAPCLHVAFGDATTILAALALVNRAYALLWQAIAESPRDLQRQTLAYVEQRLGIDGLLNGQSMDIHYASLPHDRITSEAIALGKTVSLIRLALVLPAILGGAPAAELILLERISLFWGLSYQILDDLKDVLHTSETTGKTEARDAALDRPNIALILGVPAAINRLNRLIHIGNLALQRILQARPALGFLTNLRSDLQRERDHVTDIARTIVPPPPSTSTITMRGLA